jgi:hypothetical protein
VLGVFADELRRPTRRNAASRLCGTAPAMPLVLPGRVAHELEAGPYDDARSHQGATRQAVVGRLLANHGIGPLGPAEGRRHLDVTACGHSSPTLGLAGGLPRAPPRDAALLGLRAIRDGGPGPLAQVLREPVASEHRHAGEGAWSLERVGGPRHDLESGLPVRAVRARWSSRRTSGSLAPTISSVGADASERFAGEIGPPELDLRAPSPTPTLDRCAPKRTCG